MAKILLPAEKVQEYIDYGRNCKKSFHMSVTEGTIEASNGLIIRFTPMEDGSISLRTNRSATGAWPKVRITLNPTTGKYSSKRCGSFEKKVAELFKGVMLKGLYEVHIPEREPVENGAAADYVPIAPSRSNRNTKKKAKPSGSTSTSWSPAAQSPKTGHKKFTRPEKQVSVKGYIRRTKDGREIFVRGYDRYRDRPENTEVKEYQA